MNKDKPKYYIPQEWREEQFEPFREFPNIEYSETLFRKSINRTTQLHESLIKEQLPLPEAYMRGGTMDYECKSCHWKNRCYTQIMGLAIGKDNLKALEEAIRMGNKNANK
jgi:hypothetical protein